ncbi:MAG: DUF975 family protein [Clostridiales bacterium]|nr:DUF975 family protein [Clostridiales bacterium]
MNNINRVLVKSQAKSIIKGKVFKLFLISLIVSLLAGGVTNIFNLSSNIEYLTGINDYLYSDDFFGSDSDDYDDYGNYYNFGDDGNYYGYDEDGDYYGGNDLDYFNNYGTDNYDNDSENPIESFTYDQDDDTSIIDGADSATIFGIGASAITSILSFSTIVTIIFLPLTVTLAGIYLSIIRRNPDDEFSLGTELGGLFKNSFNNTFFKKLVVIILKELIATLLTLLFIIPGIIFNYSSYFAYQIMSDNPNLKPSEAIKLSKKMIKGNRTELFVLDLSFIPWYLLTAITLGIANIYVIPYVSTTKALYYENFRLRALSEGRITPDDFLSKEELNAKYNQNTWQSPNGYDNQNVNSQYYQTDYSQNNTAYNANNYYQPQQDNSSSGQNDDYYYTPPKEESSPQPENDPENDNDKNNM